MKNIKGSSIKKTTKVKKAEKFKKDKKDNVKKRKKKSLKRIVLFLVFELIFAVITFPFILLYGPFENSKKAYVGAAMGSMTHQYFATLFLSEERINNIIGNSEQTYNATTDVNAITVDAIKDDTIELFKIDNNSKFTGYYLVIKDPTRVKIGLSSKLETEGETTSTIAENNDAIAAINGGAFVDKTTVEWTGSGAYPDGIVISDGELIWNSLAEGAKTDVFGINKEGVLIVGQYSYDELKELEIQEALSFGPALIIDGELQQITKDGGIAPRTAIGQTKDGEIILLVIDGRSLSSKGATYTELQEVMAKLKAVNAFNLDGGKSTTMYYDEEIINTPSNSMGERALPTAVIVKR